jgi:hypothetical protein
MKKLFLLPVAFAFLYTTPALAQSSAKPEEKISSKTTTISGKVSDDAATITDDKAIRWTVTNPVMLESLAGQTTTIKGHAYKGGNKIQVTSAVAIAPNATVVGNRDTSAFRR